MVNYVHFILHGECRLIEHLLVRERPSYHGVQFELYNDKSPGPQELRTVSKKPASLSDRSKLAKAELYNTLNEVCGVYENIPYFSHVVFNLQLSFHRCIVFDVLLVIQLHAFSVSILMI